MLRDFLLVSGLEYLPMRSNIISTLQNLLRSCSNSPPLKLGKEDKNGMQRNKEFIAEIMTLSLIQHPDLIGFMGYDADGDLRFLVYEYLHMRNSERHLFCMLTLHHIHFLYFLFGF